MSTLHPVREVSEEDLHFTTNDADVLELLREATGDMRGEASSKCFLRPTKETGGVLAYNNFFTVGHPGTQHEDAAFQSGNAGDSFKVQLCCLSCHCHKVYTITFCSGMHRLTLRQHQFFRMAA